MPLRRSIKVDDEVYERLRRLTKELGVESPNQVLRKVLIEGMSPGLALYRFSNGFAERLFRCLESTGISFTTAVSCAAWARALEELGDRPAVIAIEVTSSVYEVTVVRDVESCTVLEYRMDGRVHSPVTHELSPCLLIGLLLGVREELEQGTHIRRLGHECRLGSYGEYITYTCPQNDTAPGHRHVLLMVRRDVLEKVPRIDEVIEVGGLEVRRLLTSYCYSFVGPLPIQSVPQVIYIAGRPSWLRIGVPLCNAWNGTASGDMFIEIELEDRAKLEAVYNELVKIFGRKGVRKRRKSIKVESHVHTIAALYGVELGELRKLEDLSTVLGSIDNLVATILKRVFSCIGVAPSMRRA